MKICASYYYYFIKLGKNGIKEVYMGLLWRFN